MSPGISTLQSLLEPQERFDALIASTFKRLGPRTIDLSYANPADGPGDEVLAILARATAESKGLALQYTPIAGRTASRRAVAGHLARRWSMPFDYRDIVLTAGAMPAINIVSRALFAPGDEVIVLTPAWQDYPLYLRNLGVDARLVPLRGDKHLDLDAIAGAIGPATRGLLFSQPCCPTGVMYSREEIDALAAVLAGTAIYVISDEVHRDVVWSGKAFHSPMQSHPRTVSIYSFGKAFAMQGQRIGYLALSPLMPAIDEIRSAIERCVRVLGFGHPVATMQRAVNDLVDCRPDVTTLALSQQMVRRALASYGYEVCEGDASFYVYVKSPVDDDFRFAEMLASRGVLVVPSSLFHDPGYVRVSLTARARAIAVALPVFESALHELGEVVSA